MLLDRKKYSGFGFIDEDLLGTPEKELLHKCVVVERSILDGDFNMEEALKAYGLSKETYENYISSKSSRNIFISLSGESNSVPEIQATNIVSHYLEVISKMMEASAQFSIDDNFRKRISKITTDISALSRNMEDHSHCQ